MTGIEVKTQITGTIIMLGVFIILSGLSKRFNGDLIYMMMYDSYYIGMQEILIDRINRIELTDLLKKEVNDEYNAVFVRAGALTDFISSFCILLGQISSIIMLLVLALSISEVLFIVFLIYALGVYVLNSTFVEKLRWDTSRFQALQRLSSYYEKMSIKPSIAKEIRIYDLEDYIIDKWKQAYKPVEDFEERRSFQMQIRNLISGLVFIVLIIVIISFCIISVSNGQLQVDEFLVVFMLCINLQGAMRGVASNYMRTDYGQFSLERQYNFIKYAPKMSEKGSKQAKNERCELCDTNIVIEAKNLTFTYGNGFQAIKDINFQIMKNEIIALVGLNGSGKTTLSKLLIELYKPSSGEMLFYGKPYKEYDEGYVRDQIGVFFQNTYMFHTPFADNVGYGDKDNINDKNRVMKAVEKADAQKILKKLPDGLGTILGKDVDPNGVELSGGEKQKIAIARGYAGERPIIVFDEPASKLDPIAEIELFNQIKRNLHGITAILISHRMGFGRMADRILVMDGGEIKENGTHDELIKNQEGLYYRMFHEQAKWYEHSHEKSNEIAIDEIDNMIPGIERQGETK